MLPTWDALLQIATFKGPSHRGRNSSAIGKSVMFVRYRNGRALTKVRRKSDMKSHLKFIHKETNPSILGLTIAKATSQMARATYFIHPRLLKYNFRRAETFPTAGVLSLPGFPSMMNVAPGTVVISPPVIEPSSSLEPFSSSLEQSSSSLQPSSPELDPSSSLL